MLEANVSAVMETTGLGRVPTSAVLTVAVFVLGLPAALSYSEVNLQISGTRVLDIMDETLGTLGLPLGALIIAVTFRWLLSADLLEGQLKKDGLARRLLPPATKYAIPAVLVIIVASSAVSTAKFAGWQLLPEQTSFGALTRDVLVVVLLPLLLLSTLTVVATLGWWATRDRKG